MNLNIMDNKSNGSLITPVKSYDNAELLKKAIFSLPGAAKAAGSVRRTGK